MKLYKLRDSPFLNATQAPEPALLPSGSADRFFKGQNVGESFGLGSGWPPFQTNRSVALSASRPA